MHLLGRNHQGHQLDLDQLVLDRLDRAGVLASSGAACSAGGTQPSHVLLAMGESPQRAKMGVRLSLGLHTTPLDIAHTLRAAVQSLSPLLQVQPAIPQEQPLAESTP